MFPKSGNRFDYGKESPGAYEVKTGMLSDDPNKHFGFIDKAQRFKQIKPDRIDEEENMNLVEKASHTRQATRVIRSDKEEVLKMKMDDSYKRLQMSHEKDIAILEDKIFKNDTLLQTAIKEKSNYISTASSKDREVNELVHKESRLRMNLEKSERQVSSMQEKLGQMQQFQKKLDDAEKVNTRLRAQVERKVVDEHAQKEKEALERRVNLLQKEIESFKLENQSLLQSVTNSRSSLADVRMESEKSAESWKRQLEKKSAELESERVGNQRAVTLLDSQLFEVRSNFESIRTSLDAKLADVHEALKSSKAENIALNAEFKKYKQTTAKDSSALEQRFDAIFQSKTDLETQLATTIKDKNTHQSNYDQALKEYDHKLFQKQQLLNASEAAVTQKSAALSALNSDYSDAVAKYEDQVHSLTDKLAKQTSESREAEALNDDLLNQLETTTLTSLTTFANTFQLSTPPSTNIFDSIPSLLAEYASNITSNMSSLDMRLKQYSDQIKVLSLNGSEKDESLAFLQADSHASLLAMQTQLYEKSELINEMTLKSENATAQIEALLITETELNEAIERNELAILTTNEVVGELEMALADAESSSAHAEEEFAIARVDWTNRVNALMQRVAEYEENLAVMKASLRSVSEDKALQYATLEQTEMDLAQTVSTLQATEEKCAGMQCSIERMANEKTASEAEVVKLQQELIELDDLIQQSNDKNEMLLGEIEELVSKQQVASEVVARYESELEAALVNEMKLNDQIDAGVVEIDTLKTMINEKDASIKAQSCEIDQVKVSIDKTRKELLICQQDYDSFKNLSNADNLVSEDKISTLNTQIALLGTTKLQLESSIEQLESDLSRSRSDALFLESSSNEQAIEIVKITANKDALAISLSQLESDLHATTEALAAVRAEQTSQQTSSANLETQLRESISRLEENIRIETEKAETAVEFADEQEFAFQSEKAQLIDNIRVQSETIHTLELDCVRYEHQNEDLVTRGDMRDIEYKRITEENIASHNSLVAKHQSELSELQSDADKLSESLIVATKENDTLAKDKMRLEEELAGEAKRTAELEDEIIQRSANHVLECDQLEESITRLQFTVDQKTSNIDLLKADILKLEFTVKTSMETIEQATHDNTMQKDEMLATIDTLEIELLSNESEYNKAIALQTALVAQKDREMDEQIDQFKLLDKDHSILTTDYNALELVKRKLVLANADILADNSAMKLSISMSKQSIQELERDMTAKISEANDMQSRISQQDRELKSLVAERSEKAEEYSRMKLRVSELVESEKTINEQSQKKISAMEADFSARLDAVSSERKQAEHSLSSQKILHSNVISGLDHQIRYLETKVRESAVSDETSRESEHVNERLRIDLRENRTQLEDVSKKYQKLVRETEESKKKSMSKSSSGDKQSAELHAQILDWKTKAIKLKDSVVKSCDDKVGELTKKLAIMTTKDKVASEEMSRIANMDDEAFGHSNAHQKIKHVHTLKTQNMALKQMSLENVNVAYRRKIDELVRELDNARVEEGAFAGKKLPKVAKSFSALIGASNISNIQSDASFFISSVDENKEN